MKMKIIPIMLIFSLILASVVSAFTMPLPVAGEVSLNGAPSAGFGVVVTNLRTGDSLISETDNNGQYQVELANLPNKYYYGDEILIKACSGDDMCEKRIKATGGSVIVDFPIVNMAVGIIFKGIAIKAGDLATAIGYWWFAGFLGLVSYWYVKKTERGKKMLTTFFKKVSLGKYK